MTEEAMEKRVQAMQLEIDALRHMLEIAISTLPIAARDYILDRMWETHRKTQELADVKQTDPLRDQATVAWDAAESLRNRLEENAYDGFRQA